MRLVRHLRAAQTLHLGAAICAAVVAFVGSAEADIVRKATDTLSCQSLIFESPTGLGIRGQDRWGGGNWGDPRDNGARIHRGVDFTANLGQPVRAPAEASVVRIGRAYSDTAAYSVVELDVGGCSVKLMYVDPIVKVGDRVNAGTVIGVAQNIAHRYPDITPHVHMEVWKEGKALHFKFAA